MQNNCQGDNEVNELEKNKSLHSESYESSNEFF